MHISSSKTQTSPATTTISGAIALLLALSTLLLSGCGQAQTMSPGAPHYGSGQNAQAEVLNAQQGRAKYVTVTLGARVKKMLPEDNIYPPHEQFLLYLDNGTTVKVAHNTSLAPRVPLQAGDYVVVHGQFIWNDRGGVIHLTHHATSDHHDPGWIDFNGQRYQ